MGSPTIDGGNPIMPLQPGQNNRGKPKLVVDKFPWMNKKNKLGKMSKQLFPSPSQYSPIKNTPQVGKVYKTY